MTTTTAKKTAKRTAKKTNRARPKSPVIGGRTDEEFKRLVQEWAARRGMTEVEYIHHCIRVVEGIEDAAEILPQYMLTPEQWMEIALQLADAVVVLESARRQLHHALPELRAADPAAARAVRAVLRRIEQALAWLEQYL
jgi:hypothetical protein